MISKIVSLLAVLGLVASVSAKVKSTPEAKVLHTSALDAQQDLGWCRTDGRPSPPVTT
jgi:hypothetical protein